MAMLNSPIDSSTVQFVARRLDVGQSWLATQLRVEPQDISPTKQLTETAIKYLEYCKGNVIDQGYMAPPSKKDIFVDEPIAGRKEKTVLEAAPAIMYAKSIRLSKDCFIIPTPRPNKQLTIQEKDGSWKALDLMVAEHFGVSYYFQKMEVTSHGTYLHHVWGIFTS